MILAGCDEEIKLNGLQDGTHNLRRKRFERDHRIPTTEGRPRGPLKRSIPNRMKRFLAELHGDNYIVPPTENVNEFAHKTKTDSTVIGTFSSGTSRKSMVKVDDFGEDAPSKLRSLVRPAKPKKKGQHCTTPIKNSHVRCEKCDYPYDASKRRGPPHNFAPVVVTFPLRTGRFSSSIEDVSKKPSTTYLNLHGIKDAKIQRLKRRRSSTELYKNMVSVSFPSM
ncbi:Hypothetical protein NTJ_08549 [Nesidiocoris tenuis]|uniref:Uncharacterized protein n=1 Tax=Nesidiocoris tenuis TaxID=355587 RepID=A0ABN7AU56_9HEMI|nr:Hypothetical protein NTJ_08549 [Nesidiocoris tenuis]